MLPVMLVTLTATVQLAPPTIVAPVRPIVLPPALPPVIVPLVQLVLVCGGLAITKPEGSVSLNATLVRSSDVFGLVMVKVSVEVPLTAIGFGENALLMLGGIAEARLTVNEALTPDLSRLDDGLVMLP